MAEIHLKQHPHLYLEEKQLAVASIQTNAMSDRTYGIMDSLKPRKDIGWSSPHRKCLSRPSVVWART